MQTGIVTGQFLAERLDGPDSDTDPDDIPLSGSVTFTPSVAAWRVVSEKKTIVPVQPMTVDLDDDGRLFAFGSPEIHLRATDTTEANPTDFTWEVSFALKLDGVKVRLDAFSFELPAGTTVDLSEVAPVGRSNGRPVVRGEKGDPGGAFTYDPGTGTYTAEGDAIPIPSLAIAVTKNGTDDITVLKPSGDTRPGVWEWVHDSSAGYLFHLLTGQNASSASALIGMGIDNGGIGLYVNNKKTGVGISIQQNDTITSATAYGVYGNQMSKTAPLIHVDQADGAKQVLRVVSSESAVETNEMIELITTGVSGGGFVSARSGAVYWKSDINATQGKRLRAVQNVAADGNSVASEPDALRLSTWNGGNGGYWQKRIAQNGQSLMLQGADGTSGGRDAVPAAWFTAVETKQVSGSAEGTQIAFYGVTPVGRQSAPAAASDAASAVSSVNSLRASLVALGLLA